MKKFNKISKNAIALGFVFGLLLAASVGSMFAANTTKADEQDKTNCSDICICLKDKNVKCVSPCAIEVTPSGSSTSTSPSGICVSKGATACKTTCEVCKDLCKINKKDEKDGNDGGGRRPSSDAASHRIKEQHKEDADKVIESKLNTKDHFRYVFGDPDSTFRANDYITRAEANAMFARLMLNGMDDNKSYGNTFTDVSASEWYAKLIGFMKTQKLVEGYEDGSFRPDVAITRAEFATLASRFDKLEEKASHKFNDVDSKHWADKYIASAVAKGWIKGYPDSSFKPEQSITRAEAVTIINRMLARKADKKFVDDSKNITKFTDLSIKHWAYYEIQEAANGHDYKKLSDKSEDWTKLNDLGSMMNTK